MKGHESEFVKYVAYIISGSAVAHVLSQWQKARKAGEPFGVVDFIISAGLAIFSGVFFGLVSQTITDNTLTHFISVATGAWLSTPGVNALVDNILATVMKGKSIDRD